MTLDRWYRNFGCATPRRRAGTRAEAIARANANFEKHFGPKLRRPRGQ